MPYRYQRMPSATHGRWFTRDVDDTITNVPDSSPAVWGAVDASLLELELPYDDWYPAAGDIDGGSPAPNPAGVDGGVPRSTFRDPYGGNSFGAVDGGTALIP